MLIGEPDDRFPHDEHVWLLLDRYLAGDPSARDAVRAWLASDPGRAEIVRDLRQIRELSAGLISEERVDAAWERFLTNAQVTKPEPLTPEAPRRAHHAARPLRRGDDEAAPRLVTASLVTLVAASALIFARSKVGPLRSESVEQLSRTYVTAKGQRADIQLTDATRVTLAPESRLVVPATFDESARDVTLEGEAYFDVAHRDKQPFIVHAGHAFVRDVGTRFAVRAYAADSAVRVVVTHGIVHVRPEGAADSSRAVLSEGMEERLDAVGGSTIRVNVDTARLLGWRTGTLEFVGAPIREVAAELSRWYDVDIILADSSLGARKLTARIAGESLNHVLKLLAVAADVRADREGRLIVLSRVTTNGR